MTKIKRTVKACGNGAHLYVPREWIGKNVLITIDEEAE